MPWETLSERTSVDLKMERASSQVGRAIGQAGVYLSLSILAKIPPILRSEFCGESGTVLRTVLSSIQDIEK